MPNIRYMNQTKKYQEAKNIGLVIREKRIGKGLSQSELSKQANITRTFLNQIELGYKRPSLNTFEVIATRLNESVVDLINEAKNGSGDPRIRLAYLLGRLIKSGDDEKVNRLLQFANSLDIDE